MSLPLSNPYTEERLQKKWKREKREKGEIKISDKNKYLQHICLTCSYQHEKSSLAAWRNSSNLPMNLRKIADINIAKYTKDGFYKPEIYNTNTDSLYISSSNWDKLNEAGLVSENEYCKGKNDYGDGGIIFGLYLAPKVKYNIILTSDGILKEKKTFKGYSNYKIKVEDYIQLASGHDVTNEFDKPWGKSFTDGIVIPNEKQTKKFRSYLNLKKRKATDDEGIMYPYSDKEEMCLDENYEFDDLNYFTIQEENEDC
ncbi:hypothetical protein LOTGIDRAFT_171393 [Lottia gigantea]|uniref:Uncharacterized protein n=1 Tax=Lottia gigantea TaxID=225164 RepID=V4AHE1_LOTGI|nr:hypothetical protein LOTGIDRAFT_171393 [Lottia gigantea]ESP03454.1 hypothetical protein LOTGIDRAFT_171393 [Lottia gigantea]